MTEKSGILIIDKPIGITSAAVVNRVKKWLKVKKVGHGGTLDPLATGVLPIFVNKATKIAQFFLNEDKSYEGSLCLGMETDTGDIEGKVIKYVEKREINHEKVKEVIKDFIGKIKQTPPVYSALKVGGVPLYKWARSGVEITPKERWVYIYSLQMTSIRWPEVNFKVTCSKGTYIRSLCTDIGRALGCGGCLARLRRIKTGPFTISDAITLETLKGTILNGTWEKYFINLNDALSHIPAIVLTNGVEKDVMRGKSILWHKPLSGKLFKGVDRENRLLTIFKPRRRWPQGIELHPIKVF